MPPAVQCTFQCTNERVTSTSVIKASIGAAPSNYDNLSKHLGTYIGISSKVNYFPFIAYEHFLIF